MHYEQQTKTELKITKFNYLLIYLLNLTKTDKRIILMIKFARDSINVYLIGEEKSQCPEGLLNSDE